MSGFDWIVLIITVGAIVLYGIWKTRKDKGLDTYLLDSKKAKWYTIGLSVMATQASAITFLSTPGQAFHDGMGFVQFYFGLPIAIVIICITFIPIYSRLGVYTAYEFLEDRFNLNTRLFTAFLFLLQRGLAAGITIYAPAIVLSTVLDIDLHTMILVIGGLVILYTVLGGTAAVNVTQKYQMFIIFLGLFIAFGIILSRLPEGINFSNALEVAGAGGKMEILDFSFNLNDRYTFWTGILGGSFLALSYFGTDQSQVQRYLTGASIAESRLGLLFNALFKVPMQFFILLVGVMVFVFYQFNSAPVFFNEQVEEDMYTTASAEAYKGLEGKLSALEAGRQDLYTDLLEDPKNATVRQQIKDQIAQEKTIRTEAKTLIAIEFPQAETNDKDYVFIYFILNNLPRGLIGLLLAVFFCAAMSSTASELNALASTTLIDFYKRLKPGPESSDQHFVSSAKLMTVGWGIIAILFASFASLFENLIQFVNIIGSLFYGTILGIFLVAFYLKKVNGNSVLWAAIISEIIVLLTWKWDWVMQTFFDIEVTTIAFLWLNLVGCVAVAGLSLIIQAIKRR
ncbi:MAG: SSS family solute:Na+ symporter [Saprospiraceae bacterium]|jgi:SSS family solute:Na+ symporter